jgi:glycosyltransferase involved in cell wall biosynthesis
MENNEEPMLLVLPWSPDLPGGVSVVVRNLARVWDAAGIPASILVSDWSSRRLSVDKNGRFSLKLGIFGRLSLAVCLKSLLFSPLTLWRTWSLLKKQHIGAVYFHYANLDAFGVALLKRLGLFKGRLILCFHGTDVREPKSRLESTLWKVVFGSANVVTACSNALAREVEASFALPDGCVATIYNGVNTDIFSRTSARKAVAWKFFDANIQRYMVSVGSFIERKGHRSLLEAFAHVSRLFPELGLVVLGMDGDQRASLESQVVALGVQKSVRFLVNLQPEQVADIVGGATLCVQPSLAEPFGMAVIEAGASGICVAASAVGGHLELISHRQTGFLFGASDVKEMASVLLEILRDEVQSVQVAKAFHAKVVSTFTWRACADLYKSAGEPV